MVLAMTHKDNGQLGFVCGQCTGRHGHGLWCENNLFQYGSEHKCHIYGCYSLTCADVGHNSYLPDGTGKCIIGKDVVLMLFQHMGVSESQNMAQSSSNHWSP